MPSQSGRISALEEISHRIKRNEQRLLEIRASGEYHRSIRGIEDKITRLKVFYNNTYVKLVEYKLKSVIDSTFVGD